MATSSLSTSSVKKNIAKYSSFSASIIPSPKNHQPAGTSRALSISCSDGTISADEGSITQMGTLRVQQHVNYATDRKSFSIIGFVQPTGSGVPAPSSNSIVMNGIPVLNGINYTYSVWYKGTQLNASSQSYAVPVTIFGDPRGSVYMGYGLSSGKIARGSNGVVEGTTIVANDQWNMLTWVYKSSNQIDAYVNGNLEISNANTSSPSNNNIDYIGATYPYGYVDAPDRLARIQLYSQALSESQIKEIYNIESKYF